MLREREANTPPPAPQLAMFLPKSDRDHLQGLLRMKEVRPLNAAEAEAETALLAVALRRWKVRPKLVEPVEKKAEPLSPDEADKLQARLLHLQVGCATNLLM